MTARRAVARWAVRMFRREWRQQVLVLALMSVAVAAAVFVATFAYHAPTPGDEYFGRADHRMGISGGAGGSLDDALRAARARFGTVEVIDRHRIDVPGSTESLDVRAQDPHGVFSAPTIALLDGRYPVTAAEVALTRKAARLLDTGLGRAANVGTATRTVVGIVENPTALNDQFVLETIGASRRATVELLFSATETQMANLPDALRPGNGDPTDEHATVFELTKRGQDEQAAAAALGFAMGSVVMLLVCLVAAAGFVVIAQRRARQLGMMAAVGASDRHLRMVVLLNGALVGMVAALVGNALAVVVWVATSDRLQHVVVHRWSRFDVPWWIPAIGALLAVVTSTAAAWWPARVVARTPVVQALSGRPPQPSPVRVSGLLAVVLLAVGFAALAGGFDVKHDHATVPLVILGTLAIAAGMLFVSPVAIRLLARATPRLPLASRLALRDLGRHQSRSGAALAAISLGLGIATAIAVIAAAVQHSPTKQNLADSQVLFHLGTGKPGLVRNDVDVDVAGLGAQVHQFARGLPSAHVIPLFGASSAASPRALAVLAREISSRSYRDAGELYVATPELLTYLGIDPGLATSVDVLTWAPGNLQIFNATTDRAAPTARRIDPPPYTSVPRSLITLHGMERFGLTALPAGWLVESSHALTSDQQAAARALGARIGLYAETKDDQQSLATTRTVATAAGVLLAFAILAMTVGLIRSEAAADLRTLTAAGATSSTRRDLTAATAGSLALVGALLGTAGAYAALIAGYLDRVKDLSHVPVTNLAITIIALPLAAAAGGWLLAGREPSAVARQPLAT